MKNLKSWSTFNGLSILKENNNDEIYDVVFKMFNNGEVIALFPNEKWNSKGDILSYMHIGQHGGASRDLLDELEDADDYSELYDELISLGYNLNVLN